MILQSLAVHVRTNDGATPGGTKVVAIGPVPRSARACICRASTEPVERQRQDTNSSTSGTGGLLCAGRRAWSENDQRMSYAEAGTTMVAHGSDRFAPMNGRLAGPSATAVLSRWFGWTSGNSCRALRDRT